MKARERDEAFLLARTFMCTHTDISRRQEEEETDTEGETTLKTGETQHAQVPQ